MTFGRPEVLSLLWVLPAVAALAFFRYRRLREMRRRMGRLQTLEQTSRLRGLPREAAHAALLLLTLAFLAAALALPRLEQQRYEPLYRGLDLIFLLDTSPSMGAGDIQPSRLAKAREVVTDFLLHKEESDRAALVGFSESSMIYSYLTSDTRSLLFYFDYINIGEESLYGTSIGAAIRSGLAVVERERTLFPNRSPNQTAFILISDGDDRAGGLPEALELARQQQARIYTIGVGTRRGADIPIRVQGQRQFLVDEQGARLLSALQEENLKTAAASTGGRYYRASSPEDLELALAQLLVQERSLQGYRQTVVPLDLYPYLLILALVGSLGLVIL